MVSAHRVSGGALRVLAAAVAVTAAAPARAADGLDGAAMGAVWAIPFVGILLSLAFLPVLAHDLWERNRGKIAAAWACLAILPMALTYGPGTAAEAVVHTALLEYVPFILLLLALFTVAGGIVIRGNFHGSPLTNVALLAVGGAMASVIGTTGAAMIMIRPLVRANDDRRTNAHVFIFFIFIVANIGGALTPLGDPPLFLGFLRGVAFFWPTLHLAAPTAFLVVMLLALFYAYDSRVYARDGHVRPDPTPDLAVSLQGGINYLLVPAIVGVILLSSVLDLGEVAIIGTPVPVGSLLRDAALLAITLASVAFTPAGNRAANSFGWEPIREVAQLFAGIFATIIPVLAMLRAGADGAFAPLVSLVGGAENPDVMAYFWISGGLSSFLDNAPTYVVFFELAGGDPAHLMNEGARTLTAISAGAVYMGALTYIGNAPNVMCCSIARAAGVRMPGFFGYMLWSGAILLPLFLALSLVMFYS